jgi:hypothetical protein
MLKGKHYATLSEFKELVESCFKQGRLSAVVVDVMIIPNYVEALQDCLDKKLANLHKREETQHQWRFKAVPTSPLFPLGCKTTYRAYSSDEVVEFIVKPKNQCVTQIGRYLGLEPVRVYCRWYPTKDCHPERGTEFLPLLNIVVIFWE